MTMPSDPFQPEQEAPPASSAAQEWNDALNDPKVRSTLLSFGLQMMTPAGFGQSTMGQFAQGIGAAGEGLTRADEEDRKASEQARKERDTSSQIDYRADRTDVARGNLENAEQRTTINRLDQESKARERSSRIELNAAKIPGLEAQTEMLRMKVQLAPQDMEAKIQYQRAKAALFEAQTGLAVAKAEAVAPVAASQVRRNESSASLNETRQQNVGATMDLNRGRLDATNRKLSMQETIDRQKGERQDRGTYEKAKAAHNKDQIMKTKAQQSAFPTYNDWLSQNSPKPAAAPPAAPGASPAPTAPATASTPDSALPAMPSKKEELKANTRYMTPRGPATWNGTKFVE